MELIFGQEGEPADSIALILSQISLDVDRYTVLLGLAAVQELH